MRQGYSHQVLQQMMLDVEGEQGWNRRDDGDVHGFQHAPDGGITAGGDKYSTCDDIFFAGMNDPAIGRWLQSGHRTSGT